MQVVSLMQVVITWSQVVVSSGSVLNASSGAVPYAAVFGKSNLFVSQVLPGYCSENSPSGSTDCFMGEGMMKAGFAQTSFIGAFCQPQLQSSAHDPKGYSSTVWGGGQNFPIQAFPYPYYYYDKYRALAMEIGQNMSDPSCGTSDMKNSLGWSQKCSIVTGCEATHDHLKAAYTAPGTHIDMRKVSETDLSCLNYMAYTAIAHARKVCTMVKGRKTP